MLNRRIGAAAVRAHLNPNVRWHLATTRRIRSAIARARIEARTDPGLAFVNFMATVAPDWRW